MLTGQEVSPRADSSSSRIPAIEPNFVNSELLDLTGAGHTTIDKTGSIVPLPSLPRPLITVNGRQLSSVPIFPVDSTRSVMPLPVPLLTVHGRQLSAVPIFPVDQTHSAAVAFASTTEALSIRSSSATTATKPSFTVQPVLTNKVCHIFTPSTKVRKYSVLLLAYRMS